MNFLNTIKQRCYRRLSCPYVLAFVCASILCLLPLGLTATRSSQEQAAASLAPQILRFHVLANSNSPLDQQLKLEVRDVLLHTIYEHFEPKTADGSERKETAENTENDKTTEPTKDEILSYIKENSDSLKAAAERYLQSRGVSYPVDLRIEQCYFPTRQYGSMTFPSGTYDAVRVLLGRGAGRNWWCVLYPPLCFSAAIPSGDVPDSSQNALKAMVSEEDYAWMQAKRNIIFGTETTPGKEHNSETPSDAGTEHRSDTPTAPGMEDSTTVTIQVRFRLAEWLSSLRSD